MVRADFSQAPQLLLAAGAGDHFRTDHLCNLHAGDTDATACTENQHALAAADAATVQEHAICGAVGKRQGGRLFKAHTLRNLDERRLSDGNQFGATAVKCFAQHSHSGAVAQHGIQ